MSQDHVKETCCCGAEWFGPTPYGSEREKFRDAHTGCRRAYAQAVNGQRPDTPSSVHAASIVERAKEAERARLEVQEEARQKREKEKESDKLKGFQE